MSTQTSQVRNYTIKEAAKLSGLTESTLRYYETIGLIPHIERDASSKYRVYREADIDYIVSVACLSATGLSIEGMLAYLKNVEVGEAAADKQIKLLDDQNERLLQEEKSLKLRQKYLRTKADYWRAVKGKDQQLANQISEKAVVIAKEVKALQQDS